MTRMPARGLMATALRPGSARIGFLADVPMALPVPRSLGWNDDHRVARTLAPRRGVAVQTGDEGRGRGGGERPCRQAQHHGESMGQPDRPPRGGGDPLRR